MTSEGIRIDVSKQPTCKRPKESEAKIKTATRCSPDGRKKRVKAGGGDGFNRGERVALSA